MEKQHNTIVYDKWKMAPTSEEELDEAKDEEDWYKVILYNNKSRHYAHLQEDNLYTLILHYDQKYHENLKKFNRSMQLV